MTELGTDYDTAKKSPESRLPIQKAFVEALCTANGINLRNLLIHHSTVTSTKHLVPKEKSDRFEVYRERLTLDHDEKVRFVKKIGKKICKIFFQFWYRGPPCVNLGILLELTLVDWVCFYNWVRSNGLLSYLFRWKLFFCTENQTVVKICLRRYWPHQWSQRVCA